MDDLLGRKNVNFSYELDKNDVRYEKYKTQRMERGFDDSETWNLDLTIVNFMIPRLKVYKEKTAGYPGKLSNIEEWYAILDKIIEGFELWTTHFDWEVNDINTINENNMKVDEALKLFAEYFRDLWW